MNCVVLATTARFMHTRARRAGRARLIDNFCLLWRLLDRREGTQWRWEVR